MKQNMKPEKEALDYLGEFLMKNYRDRTLSTLETAFKKSWKSESFQEFQNFLQDLLEKQRDLLFKRFEHLISGALHDILFNLQEENHFNNRIQLLVDEEDVVKISDGIQGEQYNWIKKFSKLRMLNRNVENASRNGKVESQFWSRYALRKNAQGYSTSTQLQITIYQGVTYAYKFIIPSPAFWREQERRMVWQGHSIRQTVQPRGPRVCVRCGACDARHG